MLWTPERQLAFYEQIGYHKRYTREDGSVWERPDETDRFLLDWTARMQLVICPRRSSKSYATAKKALPIVLGRETLPDGSGPKPTRTWIVGPTYELAEKEFRYLWQDLMIIGPRELGLPKPLLSRDSKKAGDLYIKTAWGSEVIGKSADKPQSLLGEEVDCLILSEAAQLPGGIWERFLQPTLATTQGYALFPTTPDGGALWLYDMYLKAIEGSEPSLVTYTWPVTGNPIYPVSEYVEKKRYYGENHPVFQEQYEGRWTFQEGNVFGADFVPSRHVVDPFPIPAEWGRIRALDFGYRDPFVCLWLAVAEASTEHKTKRGDLILYREYYQKQRSMAAHAETIRKLSEGERVLYSVADSSEQQSIADLRTLGIPAIDSNRDRRAGRLLVADYLRSDRLRIFRGVCPNTIREFAFYRWDRDRDKEGAKEATLGDDHAMDALRYAIMSRPQPRVVKPARVPANSFEGVMKRMRMERLDHEWLTPWSAR